MKSTSKALSLLDVINQVPPLVDSDRILIQPCFYIHFASFVNP
ncbi:hypothetical protein ACF3DV_33580 (plasmid) [Chlorogloeopsis fritschii PCC 9212]|nr:hypothetical protein [Chlorogloeopsis fritschii]